MAIRRTFRRGRTRPTVAASASARSIRQLDQPLPSDDATFYHDKRSQKDQAHCDQRSVIAGDQPSVVALVNP